MQNHFVPPMRMYQFFDPTLFWTEVIYALIIIILFLTIFFKTKKLSEITKYKGILYFRIAFLFFTFAFISRLIFYIMLFVIRMSELHVPPRYLMFISLIAVTYFSTIAIGYLIYSTIWKKLHHSWFLLIAHLFALLTISIYYFRYPLIYFLILQGVLVFILFAVNVKKSMQFVYPLISLFWILNVIIFYSRRLLDFDIKLSLQIASVFLLIYFIYRVTKWTK